ncbi:hypothetical protein LSM04_004724 [Trypanosoma melophagium]|uniref:uncharacterized protein n=1 Tax=Trypanosoma melophagium TaxID=715481 RepID=UPI00351A6E91|nr:hypothetical protein LSM04_004724 [Trypanosoma melophagium]
MVRFDLSEVVKSRVMRSVTSPFYSVMREESTRQDANIEHGRASTQTKKLCNPPTLLETERHYICFPQQNTIDVRKDLDTPTSFSTVTLIGGTGFFARFVAEQCLRRGISVTVLARDLNKAKSVFTAMNERSVASGVDFTEEHRTDIDIPGIGSSVRYTYRTRPGAVAPLQVELLQGDVCFPEAIRHAVRQASLVLYTASAKNRKYNDKNSNSNWFSRCFLPGCAQVDVGGLRHTVEACNLVDAHLVVFVPLFNRPSWISPLQWIRRALLYPRGYLKATRQQERLLLNDDGTTSTLCMQGGTPLRFTLFRVCNMVYPTFNERMVIAKNNKISDPIHLISLRRGDINAKMLANVMLRAVALCRSSIGSRLDVAGHMRHGVDLAHVDNLLQALRHE